MILGYIIYDSPTINIHGRLLMLPSPGRSTILEICNVPGLWIIYVYFTLWLFGFSNKSIMDACSACRLIKSKFTFTIGNVLMFPWTTWTMCAGLCAYTFTSSAMTSLSLCKWKPLSMGRPDRESILQNINFIRRLAYQTLPLRTRLGYELESLTS